MTNGILIPVRRVQRRWHPPMVRTSVNTAFRFCFTNGDSISAAGSNVRSNWVDVLDSGPQTLAHPTVQRHLTTNTRPTFAGRTHWKRHSHTHIHTPSAMCTKIKRVYDPEVSRECVVITGYVKCPSIWDAGPNIDTRLLSLTNKYMRMYYEYCFGYKLFIAINF